MLPAQAPGGPELLVIGLIVLIPLLLVAGVGGAILYIARKSEETQPTTEEVQELVEQRREETESD